MTITKSGSPISFYTIDQVLIRHLKVYFTPIQEGSGDPSATNIRPISCHNNIICYNAQIYQPVEIQNFSSTTNNGLTTYLSDNLLEFRGTSTAATVFNFNIKPMTLTSSINTFFLRTNKKITEQNKIIIQFRKNGDSVMVAYPLYSQLNNDMLASLTLSNNIEIDEIRVIFAMGVSDVKIQPIFVQYKKHDNLTLSNLNANIYGGYVDLVTGIVSADTFLLTLNGDEEYLTYQSNYHRLRIKNFDTLFGRPFGDPISNVFKTSGTGSYGINYASTTTFTINLNLTFPSSYTEQDARNYIQQNNVQICYTLKDPIEYQLTPQQLKTLVGQNCIWTNADNIEIEYDLAESSDELYRRRHLILQSYPHIESINGTGIVTFNTDLIAPLKECKISFPPNQDGSGDPSPTNIRQITNTSYVNITHIGENLFNSNVVIDYGYIRNDAGEVQSSSNYFYISTMFPITYPEYIILTGFTCTVYRIYFLDSSGNMISRSNYYVPGDKSSSFAIPTPENCKYFQIQFSNDADISTLEIYHGPQNTIQINQISGASGYGGTIDLINGQYTDNYLCRIIPYANNASSLIISNSGLGILVYNTGGIFGSVTAIDKNDLIITNMFKRITLEGSIRNVNTPWSFLTYNNYLVFIGDTTLTTKDAWTDFMINTGTIIMAAKASSPTIYQLTPQQIKTFKGTNNIWFSANGTVDIKYWTH